MIDYLEVNRKYLEEAAVNVSYYEKIVKEKFDVIKSGNYTNDDLIAYDRALGSVKTEHQHAKHALQSILNWIMTPLEASRSEATYIVQADKGLYWKWSDLYSLKYKK